MTRKKKKKAFARSEQEIAAGILSSVSALRSMVRALAEHQIEVVLPTMSEKQVRYAPHFAKGKGKDEPNAVAYSLPAVAKLIGATYPRKDRKTIQVSRWMKVGMLLLECEELGIVGPEIYEKIAQGAPGFKVKSLLKTLKELKESHELMASTRAVTA